MPNGNACMYYKYTVSHGQLIGKVYLSKTTFFYISGWNPDKCYWILMFSELTMIIIMTTIHKINKKIIYVFLLIFYLIFLSCEYFYKDYSLIHI